LIISMGMKMKAAWWAALLVRRKQDGPAVVRWILSAALVAAASLGAAPARAWDCSHQAEHTLEWQVNLGQLKLQLRDYRYCGGYDHDFRLAAGEAKAYVEARAHEVERPALVLDIDETSLSNWLEIEQDDFAYIPGGSCTLQPGLACGDLEWELSARAEALKPTLELFNAAKNLGVAVFFITGRTDRPDLRAATVTNLKQAGYDGWQDLVMRPVGSAGSVSDYKSGARKAIADDRHYRIIANVGDQDSDLRGGYAEKTFRVPNPFYFIP
jgi:HAD superfamily, subfamily IIIB (Acid phosphatase)